MFKLALVGVFAILAFLIAWIVNGIIGILSGERPQDTGSLWIDVFCKLLAVFELGFLGRLLNNFGFQGIPRKLILLLGLLCLLAILLRTIKPDPRDSGFRHTYPAISNHVVIP